MTLDKIDSKQSLDYLTGALKDSDWEIRQDAVKHLRRLKR
jgi:hypothetical protein